MAFPAQASDESLTNRLVKGWGLGWSTPIDHVHVCLQFRTYGMSQVIEVDADPFSVGKLEGRNEIAVSGHNDDRTDHISQCKPCDIETDSQMTPFCSMAGTKS